MKNSYNVELREWQEKLKDKVAKAIKENFLVAINAPTGSGKTIFSLLILKILQKKGVYVVRTHNEYFPIYRDLKKIDTKLRFSFIVGKPASCPFADKDVDPEDINCKYCELKEGIREVDTNEKPPLQLLRELKKNAIEERFCPYYSLFNSLQEADVIAITYPYFFIDRFRESLGIDFEDYLVIVDEAHNLDRVGEIEERRLSEFTINMAIKEVKSKEAINTLERIKEELKKIVLPDEKYIKLDKVPQISTLELEILADEYEDLRKRMLQNKQIKRIYLGAVIRFYTLLSTGEFAPFSHSGKIVLKNPNIGEYLRILNDESYSFLLMSGTLPPREYIEKVWGVSRRIYYVDVEKEVKKRISGTYDCIIGIDITSKYDLRSETLWKKYSNYLLKIYYQAKKHVLAIFPSYAMMNEVMKYIDLPKYIEKENTIIDEVYEEIRKHDKIIISAVGRGKLSEGIELTEQGKSLISDVVIAGIPYPPPDDYLKLVAQKLSEKLNGKEEEFLFKIPALITVKQSIGRAIRGVDDHAKVWLLDKRFDSLWWKKNLNCFNATKMRL
ncbi:MAG: ATP-dependent DNA helicase [Sulfolobaceae archaeon]